MNLGLSEWYSPVVPGTGGCPFWYIIPSGLQSLTCSPGLHPRPHDASTLKQYFPLIDPSWESIYYPDRHGETIEGVHERCDEFLSALISRIERHPTLSQHKTILLVSHAATIAAIIRSLLGNRQLPIRVGTCSLSVLERDEDAKWRARGTLAGAEFLPKGVERDWGFEDAEIKFGEVIEDRGIAGAEDPGFTGLVPEKS